MVSDHPIGSLILGVELEVAAISMKSYGLAHVARMLLHPWQKHDAVADVQSMVTYLS